MCGIFGVCRLDGGAVDPAALRRASELLRHRGPDDEGYLLVDTRTGAASCLGGPDTDGRAAGADVPWRPNGTLEHATAGPADLAFVNRRLAIVDLSPAGHQPMGGERSWLTYNGEMYPFPRVREELERAGHRFHSHTDTEVVLRAYDEWGTAAFERLNGMWGLALWDAERRTIVLCRDRYGVKPLYYTFDGAQLVFASEIKAILAYPGVHAQPNERVIADYLAAGHVDHTDETFFAGIRSLPPGTLAELSLDRRAIVERRWYSLPTTELRVPEFNERFRETLTDAVGLRLVSDVPVGTCLSGGLDSSAIVVTLDRLLAGGAHAGTADRQLTFSARYDDPRHDEGRYIDAVARATSIESHVVRPSPEGLAGCAERLVWHQDEPFGSTSMYAQWEVFRLAREHGVVVTLDGQGGDEVAGGYTHYYGAGIASLLRRTQLRAALRDAGGYRATGASAIEIARRTSAALLPWAARDALGSRTRRPAWLALPRDRPARPEVLDGMPADPLQGQIYRDIVVGLRNLLRSCDRNSMAHSVESRLPFLDYRLVELGVRAPAREKLLAGRTKLPVRDGLGDLLPAEVTSRRDKIGFSTPEDEWFRGALRPWAQDVIASASFKSRPWFVHHQVQRTFDAHLAGANHAREIWRWINLELWQRLFLDR